MSEQPPVIEICRIVDDQATGEMATIVLGSMTLNTRGEVEMIGMTTDEAAFWPQFAVWSIERKGPITMHDHPREWLETLPLLPEPRLGYMRFARVKEPSAPPAPRSRQLSLGLRDQREEGR